jgi:HEAT repeat protein
MGARALSAASGRVAVADLHLALAQETDVTVKSQIIRSLGQVSGLDAKTTQTIFTELIDIIEKSPIDLKTAAVNALGSMQLKTATEPLIKQLKDHHGIKEYAAAIVEALGNIGDDRALEILVIMLENHGSPLVRGEAATALGKIGGKGIAALKGRLKQEKDAVVIFAIKRALMQNLHWEFKSAEATP